MERITYKNFSCWCDSYRAASLHYGGKVVLASLFGNTNEVRAIWAALIRGQQRGQYVQVKRGSDPHTYLSLDEKSSYIQLRRPLDRQHIHIVLLHPEATTQLSAFEGYFHLLGAHPEQTFFNRLCRLCPVPMRASWRETIWALGVHYELIKEIPGYGVPAHTIYTDGRWVEVIQNAVKEGVLR